MTYTIQNKKSKANIYSVKYNKVLPKLQNFSWNLRNALGDKISAGDYILNIVVKSDMSTESFTDTISVKRTYRPVTHYKPAPKVQLKKRS